MNLGVSSTSLFRLLLLLLFLLLFPIGHFQVPLPSPLLFKSPKFRCDESGFPLWWISASNPRYISPHSCRPTCPLPLFLVPLVPMVPDGSLQQPSGSNGLRVIEKNLRNLLLLLFLSVLVLLLYLLFLAATLLVASLGVRRQCCEATSHWWLVSYDLPHSSTRLTPPNKKKNRLIITIS